MKSEVEPNRAAADARTMRQLGMDTLVGWILLDGVLLSLGLLVIGMCWRWERTGTLSLDYQLTGMNLSEFVLTEVRMATHGELRPRLLINLGIAVLMLTPYLRVMVSVAYFLVASKNWKYASFTAVVLAILTYSLFLR
jgi:uncharacterized membrane protein